MFSVDNGREIIIHRGGALNTDDGGFHFSFIWMWRYTFLRLTQYNMLCTSTDLGLINVL